jgi:hypothetical protein
MPKSGIYLKGAITKFCFQLLYLLKQLENKVWGGVIMYLETLSLKTLNAI